MGSQGTKWQGEGVPGADVASGTVQNRVFWESPARAAKGNAHISIDSNSTGVPQRMADSSRHRLQFDVSNLCSRAVVPPQYRCMRYRYPRAYLGTHVAKSSSQGADQVHVARVFECKRKHGQPIFTAPAVLAAVQHTCMASMHSMHIRDGTLSAWYGVQRHVTSCCACWARALPAQVPTQQSKHAPMQH